MVWFEDTGGRAEVWAEIVFIPGDGPGTTPPAHAAVRRRSRVRLAVRERLEAARPCGSSACETISRICVPTSRAPRNAMVTEPTVSAGPRRGDCWSLPSRGRPSGHDNRVAFANYIMSWGSSNSAVVCLDPRLSKTRAGGRFRIVSVHPERSRRSSGSSGVRASAGPRADGADRTARVVRPQRAGRDPAGLRGHRLQHRLGGGQRRPDDGAAAAPVAAEVGPRRNSSPCGGARSEAR